MDTDFFVFNFWKLKLVPIDLALNSVLENLTYFFKISRSGTNKISQN